jgi:hypothetical protein
LSSYQARRPSGSAAGKTASTILIPIHDRGRVSKSVLCWFRPRATLFAVEEPRIYREEVTAILGAFADIYVEVLRIRRLLQDGEEEEDLEE